jgi:hypothetical protein
LTGVVAITMMERSGEASSKRLPSEERPNIIPMPTPEEEKEKTEALPTNEEEDDRHLNYFDDEKVRKPKGKKILKMRKNW